MIAVIAIIIGGNDLFEETLARELARESVDHAGVVVARRPGASLEVAGHLERPSPNAELVHVDGEPLSVQARAPAPRRAVHVGARVVDLVDPEGAELRSEP